MAELTPKKIDLSQINGGQEYTQADSVQPSAITAAIEASAYAQEIAENATNANVVDLGQLEWVTDHSFSLTVSEENYEKLSLPNTVIKLTLPDGLGEIYGLISPMMGAYYSSVSALETRFVFNFIIRISSDRNLVCNMVDITPIPLNYVSGIGSDDKWQEIQANNATLKIYVQREVPKPTASDVGKVPVVNSAGDGYELQTPSGGTVEYATNEEIDALFASQDQLIGTWVFNDNITTWQNGLFYLSFLSNGQNYSSIYIVAAQPPFQISYDSTAVYTSTTATEGNWSGNGYKTIQITDVSSLTNVDEFTTWLNANATKQ